MSIISSNKKNSAAQSLPRKKILKIQRTLLRWYRESGRDLPWRHTRDPYKVLVSEIMLQQTQVDRVIPKYQAFLKTFPTVERLARASRSRVIQLWAGLGYNRRAVYLHEAAKKVLRDFRGVVPTTIDELSTLPGVGEYTAGAVAAFSGGSTAAFLDTNIKRILGRLFFNVKQKRIPPELDLAAYAQPLIPTQKDDAYFWHHALMDLGATICVARTPKCEVCPLRTSCLFPPFRDVIVKSHYAKRQPIFKDSNRFWRGKIMAVARGSQNGFAVMNSAKRFGITHVRLQKLIRGLIRDGLLVRKGRYLFLPQ